MIYPRRLASRRSTKKVPAKKKSGSQTSGAAKPLAGVVKSYCVERFICVMLMVLMLRSMGVSGGNKLGVKNSVSKL